MLRGRTPCTFSTSQLRKVVRFNTFDFEMCCAPQLRALFQHLNFQKWSALTRLTLKCASRHNSMHFFNISTSKSGPRPSVFDTFGFECASRHNGVQFFISHLAKWLRTRRLSEPTFRPSGARNHWKNAVNFFSSLIFFLLLFSSLTLPTSAFPFVHIVGSLTSKLPSIMHTCTFIDILIFPKICRCMYIFFLSFTYIYTYICVLFVIMKLV